jgi:two-component system, sensor histidine kinase
MGRRSAQEELMDCSAARHREGSALQILAAEDNAANRMVLKALLDGFGVEITFAVNGCEAVEAAALRPFDVVFMDAHMPRMDGVEAVRLIRTGAGFCSGAPIFMLTADSLREDVRRYREAGADGVLSKPIDLSQLAAVLTGLRAKLAKAA